MLSTIVITAVFTIVGILVTVFIARVFYFRTLHDIQRSNAELQQVFVTTRLDEQIPEIAAATNLDYETVKRVVNAARDDEVLVLVPTLLGQLQDAQGYVSKETLFTKVGELLGPGAIASARRSVEALRASGQVTYDGDLTSVSRLRYRPTAGGTMLTNDPEGSTP